MNVSDRLRTGRRLTAASFTSSSSKARADVRRLSVPRRHFGRSPQYFARPDAFAQPLKMLLLRSKHARREPKHAHDEGRLSTARIERERVPVDSKALRLIPILPE